MKSLLFLLFLAGCGGGGTAPGPACVPRQVVIALFGDSTMAGIDGASPTHIAASNPPALIQAAMDARFGKGAVYVSNHAIAGTTSSQLIAGTDGLNAPWPGSVNALDADIVLMNHGINDYFAGSESTYKANLAFLASTPGMIFETPLPFDGNVGWAQDMRDAAKASGIPLIDAALVPHNAPDGTHPDSAGYGAIVDQAVLPVIVPMVARMRCD